LITTLYSFDDYSNKLQTKPSKDPCTE